MASALHHINLCVVTFITIILLLKKLFIRFIFCSCTVSAVVAASSLRTRAPKVQRKRNALLWCVQVQCRQETNTYAHRTSASNPRVNFLSTIFTSAYKFIVCCIDCGRAHKFITILIYIFSIPCVYINYILLLPQYFL